MAGICSGPGPCDVTPLGTGKNWVTKVGGLPLYIRAIAHALRRSGHSQSESIQLAIGTVQRWARGGGTVTDATRGRAAAALAEWERKRAEAHLSGSDAVSIDLAYQWKHGWIPLTPAALAVKLHKAHGGAHGVKTADARKALGTHAGFREGFQRGRSEVRGNGHGLDDVYNGADLRNKARIHEGMSEDALKRGDIRGATQHAGQAAGLRHEAMLTQRRTHAANAEKPEGVRQFKQTPSLMRAPTHEDVDTMIHNYTIAHGKPPSDAAVSKLRAKVGKETPLAKSVRLAQKRQTNLSGGVAANTLDLTGFNPAEPRGPGGTWTVDSQASAVGTNAATLTKVAQSLGVSTAQLSLMVQQANVAKATGGKSTSADKAAAASVAKAQAARITALRQAKAAFTAAEKKVAAQNLAATKLQVSVAVAQNSAPTKGSTAKATAINGLPTGQRSLLAGSVPPAGYAWSGGSLTKTTDLSGGTRMAVDLASQSQLLPDMDSVRKAASKLSKLPPPLRKAMAARLQARAKQLGATLNLSGSTGRIVDLAVDQAQRDAAKSAGLTFPGTDSFPLAGPDGKFDAGLAKKAIGMVQLSNAASAPAIRKWLMAKCKANGAGNLIPDKWNADGTTSS